MPATGVSGYASGPVGSLGRAGRRTVSGLGLDAVTAARGTVPGWPGCSPGAAAWLPCAE